MKQEGFDYQNFEKAALRALYEGKPLEEALGLHNPAQSGQ
jgi:hypothetical protein